MAATDRTHHVSPRTDEFSESILDEAVASLGPLRGLDWLGQLGAFGVGGRLTDDAFGLCASGGDRDGTGGFCLGCDAVSRGGLRLAPRHEPWPSRSPFG